MAKSVNEYYSEKMQKLLEMQKSQNSAALASPAARNDDGQKKAVGGRGYYEEFKTRVRPVAEERKKEQPRSQSRAPGSASRKPEGAKGPGAGKSGGQA